MLTVAAYCRVSTDKNDQANSFESQKRYFEEYITRNPDWELYEIYADDGLTGTSTKKRAAFNKMIADAHRGKFNLIITKEVSRFARNTVDALQYTRELKALNIGVYFALDNIHTLAPDAELRLTIMASLAQEESRKTSERVKWGQKRQMEKGVVFGRDLLGYNVINGALHINEEGAKTVRLIFHKFVFEKKGCCTIARELREAGYKTVTGNAMWSNTTVLKTLRNEKYCGDLTQKKTYTPDYLTHQKKYNHGEEEFIFLKNHHEPIIGREVWDAAQALLRKNALNSESKLKRSNRYPLSGKIFCGTCNGHFVARTKKRNTVYKAWRCFSAAKYGSEKIDAAGNKIGCNLSAQIREECFLLIIQNVVKNLEINNEIILKELFDVLKSVFSDEKNLPLNDDTIKRNTAILKLKSGRPTALYFNDDYGEGNYLAEEAERGSKITQHKYGISASQSIIDVQSNSFASICDYLKEILRGTNTDEIFYKNLVEKIVVHSREKFDVYLTLFQGKWGVTAAEHC